MKKTQGDVEMGLIEKVLKDACEEFDKKMKEMGYDIEEMRMVAEELLKKQSGLD